jgi:phospho-N-acetylmuramoyl-pentapeptide-transferase
MLYHLASYLHNYSPLFNVVHYISFRAAASLISSLICSLVIGHWFIRKSQLFFRSKTREYTPENHQKKGEMPTMGGLFILLVAVINSLLWCNLADPKMWVFLLCLLGFGAIGFWDDWCKIRYRKGMSASVKIKLQWLVAAALALLLIRVVGTPTTISFPFFKWCNPDIGFFYIPWAMFILVGCSNAVNLTDGLDGLAAGSLIPNFVTFSLLSYLAGHVALADYLHIPYVATAEVVVLGAILVGATLGFLWYNTYPAQIFMGDVGSLSLGASLAMMALMAKQELLLPIAGGLFVIEALSVIAQVFSYRVFGKKIFKMAPIHHHFELLGWQESKITVRFGIISIILCLLAVITLKVR